MKTQKLNIRFIFSVITIVLCFASSRTIAGVHTELILKSEKAVVKIIDYYSKETYGTGFIISEDGFALSCYHVFEGKKNLFVEDAYGNYFEIDSIFGYSETDDFILFKIKSEDNNSFTYLEIYSEEILKGQEVVAIGHPFGYDYLATKGTVAGLSTDNQTKIILFTAPVYFGSSGSPLINVNNGKVVGIVYAITAQNINLSIDITEGFNYLNNISAISYDEFAENQINRDNIDDWFSLFLEQLEEEEFDDNDIEDWLDTDYENDLSISDIFDLNDYIEDARINLINQIIYEATLLSAMEKIELAEKKIKKAYKLATGKTVVAIIVLNHADILILSNNLITAQSLLLKHINDYPDNEELHKKLGDVYTLRGKTELAREYYKKAYDLQKNKYNWFEW